MPRYIMTVRSNPVAGREAEYNEWYDRYHVPDLLMTPTLIAAQRYRLAPVQLPGLPRVREAPSFLPGRVRDRDGKPREDPRSTLERRERRPHPAVGRF